MKNIVLAVLMLLFVVSLHAQTVLLNDPIDPQDGWFHATWKVVPSHAPMDGIVGISQGEAAAWGDVAVAVRCKPDGYFDARNGGEYAAEDTLYYAADSTYDVTVWVDVQTNKYSVAVGPEGEEQIVIASNFAFRTGAPSDTLKNLTILINENEQWGGVAGATLTVSDFAIPEMRSPLDVITSWEENFDGFVDLALWWPDQSYHEDGVTPKFLVIPEDGALKVEMKQENFFNGQYYDVSLTGQVLDLTESPMAAAKIKLEPGALYDGEEVDEVGFKCSPFSSTPDGGRVRQHTEMEIMVPADGEWHEVLWDWSEEDDKPNEYGFITHILLETVKWPSVYEATFWIDDWKVGDAAVPPPPPADPIVMANQPPAIDGELDPIWENTPWFRNFHIAPKDDRQNDPTLVDCGLSWRGMWDDNYLYFFIEVSDDTLNYEGNDNWQDDSFEIWLDADNSKGTEYDGVNDFGFSFIYEPDNPLVFKPVKKGGMGLDVDMSGIKQGAWKKEESDDTEGPAGVRLEVAVPWNLLNVSPSAGHKMGLEIDWNDSDTPGLDRDTKCKYYSLEDQSWQNPSTLGTVELVERTVYNEADVWYTDTPWVIDGVADPAAEALPMFTLNHYLNHWSNLDNLLTDLKLDFKLAWDETYLYWFIDVNDDILHTTGTYNWQDDGVEIWFDGDNSKLDAYDGINDMGFQFPYMEGLGLDSLFLFGWDGSGHVKFDPASIMHATTLTDDGVSLEMAVPLDSIGIEPVNGWKFGVEIDWNDSDTEGVDRDTKCKSFASEDQTWTNPSYLQTAILMGGPGEPLPPEPMALEIDNTWAPPVIDGLIEPVWENAQNWQAAKVVSGATDDWKDGYVNFRMMYDEVNLYGLVEVNDDTIVTSHNDPRNNDSIELYFDGDNSKNGEDPGYDENDDQLRFMWDTAPTSAKSVIDVAQIDYAYSETDFGWGCEFTIPFDALPFDAEAGAMIGFEVQLNDNDSEGRDANIKWWADNDNAWKDPSVFGTAMLGHREINNEEWGRTLHIPFTAYPVQIDAEAEFGWSQVAPVFGNYRWNETMLNNVDSPDDIEMMWKAMWDYSNLYLWIQVKDDTLVQDGDYNHQDDGLEMWWDGDASMLEAYPDSDPETNDLSFNWRYDPDLILTDMGMWHGALDSTALAEFQEAKKLTEDGFVLELAMPWEYLGTDVGHGAFVALDVDYNDDDDGGDRDTKVKCYDPTDNSWQNPSLLGLAMLDGSKLVSDVKSDLAATVKTYELSQNYPNPFNPVTTINFSIPKVEDVKLVVYDILGREVTTLLDSRMDSGQHSVTFDARHFSSGVYFYQLRTGSRVMTKKMMLIK